MLLMLGLCALLTSCAKPLTMEESVMRVFEQSNASRQKKQDPQTPVCGPDAYALLQASRQPQLLEDVSTDKFAAVWHVPADTIEVLFAVDGMFHVYMPGEYAATEDYLLGQRYLVGGDPALVLEFIKTTCRNSLTGQLRVVFLSDAGDLRYLLYTSSD